VTKVVKIFVVVDLFFKNHCAIHLKKKEKRTSWLFFAVFLIEML